MQVGSIVIPAFNAAATIGAALDSVAAAVDRFRAWAGAGSDVRFGLVVVDDGSADATAAAVRAWPAPAGIDLHLTGIGRNQGRSRSRNLGVAQSAGPLIWFLDADDLYLPDHIIVTADLVRRHPDAGMVKTGIHFDDPIDPSWRDGLENTAVYNACVRRSAHDFVGGFLDHPCFDRIGTEDIAYLRQIEAFFPIVRTRRETVHHRTRPGNFQDRQQQKFQAPRSAEIVLDYERDPAWQRDAATALHETATRIALLRRFKSIANWQGPRLLAPGETAVRVID